MDSIELLAPAGSFDTALAAFEAGADAVYLGLDSFSARAQAVNFSLAQLSDLMSVADAKDKRIYVTFNTLLTDSELPPAVELLAQLEDIGPDALIVQDLGVARLVRTHFPKLKLHASTQLVAHNLEGVLAMRDLGFCRVVLSRELPISDVRSIAQRCGCELEVFVHGALCYSISGLCLFSAMEKGRSGNRGRCAYCCRMPYVSASGERSLPFSMKDLRLDDRLDALREAGVASLKIEGRMKSDLYVASVVRRYRELLDFGKSQTTRADLETVFSRATTHLYADGWKQVNSDIIDPVNLGHQGTPIGVAKRLTKDRHGRSWMRLHTNRALERHDGLQFVVTGRTAPSVGTNRPLGMGIGEMRLAISRKPVFDVPAGSDVEIEITDPILLEALSAAGHGDGANGNCPHKSRHTVIEVRCTMSNAVKRRFPVPSFRPSECRGRNGLDVSVRISDGSIEAQAGDVMVTEAIPSVQKALHREATVPAIRKCFEKLGGSNWHLASLKVDDPNGLFVPTSVLNSLRRNLIARLDVAQKELRAGKIGRVRTALDEERSARALPTADRCMSTVKVRLGQQVPSDGFDETIVAIGHDGDVAGLGTEVRLALPVFTREDSFNRLRGRVKTLLRRGYGKWEAADLAGLRLLKTLGVADMTADWTLYAFNSQAAAMLSEMGVKRCVASPECGRDADSITAPGIEVEFLSRQSTPLFISVTRPLAEDASHLTSVDGREFSSFETDGLWVTVRTAPRAFPVPPGRPVRLDLSWNP